MPGKGARRAGPGLCVDTEPMSRASGLKGAACQYGDLLRCRRPAALQRAVWLIGSVARGVRMRLWPNRTRRRCHSTSASNTIRAWAQQKNRLTTWRL
jgi:hypothetical protein